ncbi:hypothetical protein IL252_11825 [Halomicrobium sp. IBSBa]|uniref:hypothetical protein n=1 Tax=Halomicrobium sp. IBSBa TaxID=2778916 RepID=UPI001ABF4716|nr:hypothetical protein [Halomicrobium sp. IBSBa]MBO4248502.1 hypothetical protein [Halomicrobium sp. IBSBa]
MVADTSGHRNKIAFGLAFATVVIVPGLANYALSGIGLDTLGSAVWAIGYGLGAIAMWSIWIRPLELTGPDGVDPSETSEEHVD